jgi:hypothetical protein
LKELSPEHLAELKRQCVEATEPKYRQKMEAADPLTGGMLSVLICGRLAMEKVMGAA